PRGPAGQSGARLRRRPRPPRRPRLALPRVPPRRSSRRRDDHRRRARGATLGVMPTRKQRRRQQKARRHEWEYVYVDDEGNEVEVDEDEVATTKPQAKQRTDAVARRNGKAPGQARQPRRVPQPPSWRRAMKRAAFLGVFFV